MECDWLHTATTTAAVCIRCKLLVQRGAGSVVPHLLRGAVDTRARGRALDSGCDRVWGCAAARAAGHGTVRLQQPRLTAGRGGGMTGADAEGAGVRAAGQAGRWSVAPLRRVFQPHAPDRAVRGTPRKPRFYALPPTAQGRPPRRRRAQKSWCALRGSRGRAPAARPHRRAPRGSARAPAGAPAGRGRTRTHPPRALCTPSRGQQAGRRGAADRRCARCRRRGEMRLEGAASRGTAQRFQAEKSSGYQSDPERGPAPGLGERGAAIWRGG